MNVNDTYIINTIKLAKSIVIKLDDIGIAINNGLMFNGYDIPTDKRLWKYYLNLAGLPHETNTTNIEVYSLETTQYVPLTNTIEKDYPVTYKSLVTDNDTYKNLLLKYPNDEAYIKGMLYPVDIDVAINADNGTILNYNNFYVEEQEYSLIRKLEIFIKDFLARWHIKDYTITDDLYLASMLSVLYGNLVNKILNIRINTSLTNEAHSYHMEQYFRSHLDIWDDISVLNNKSKIWLYNNIRYLMKHVGKEETLNIIVDKIFSSNQLGIGEVILDKSDLTLDEDNYNTLTTSVFNNSEVKLISKALNKYYNNDDNMDRSISSVVTSEMTNDNTIDTDIIKDSIDYYIGIVEKELNNPNLNKQDTKLLDINSFNIFKIDNDVLVQVLFDNFVYYGYTTDNNSITQFRDPNTNIYYNLTPKTAVHLLFKLMMDMFDTNKKIESYSYFSLLDDNVTYDDLNRNTLSPNDNDYIINTVLSLLPKYPENIEHVEVFQNYVNDVVKYYICNNVITSNINNTTLITTVKVMNERILKRGTITLTEDNVAYTPTELLAQSNISIDTTGSYNHYLTISELLKTFTGVDIDRFGILDRYIQSFINIVNKLTSYTTQITKNVEDDDPITTQYTNLNINNTEVGIITVLDAEIDHALEPNFVWTKSTANDFKELSKGFDTEPGYSIVRGNCFDAIAYTDDTKKEINAFLLEPVVTVEILCDMINYYRPTLEMEDINKDNVLYATELGDTTDAVTKEVGEGITYSDDPTYKEINAVPTAPTVTVEIGE